MKHLALRKLAIAISAFATVAAVSVGWSGQADARIYVGPRYVYHPGTGIPWYAVRAFYFGGPWSGPYYSYTGWADYATRNAIGCVPGTIVKGGDGIWYNCQ